MKIIKERGVLLDKYFDHPKTMLLHFRFGPEVFAETLSRLKKADLKRASIGGKDLYLFDGFFQPEEREELHSFSLRAPFSRNSYGSSDAIERGEKPANSMNGKERWQFFHNPTAAISEIYKLFSTLAEKLDAEVMTLPWELVDLALVGSPAVIANRVEMASVESMELGKHQDSNPKKAIPFGIPILYSEEKLLHPQQFVNGAEGVPWIVTVMVYSAAADYIPEYGLGTVFYDEDRKIALRVNCSDMRFVLFESDLFHSIEASTIPEGTGTWRISYVFKMVINPKKEKTCLKKAFFDLMQCYSLEQIVSLGPNIRG